MRLGAYTACLRDKPLKVALDLLAGLGLDSAEFNSGGFLPAVDLPIQELRSSDSARSPGGIHSSVVNAELIDECYRQAGLSPRPGQP
jgi:hypothetical protein